MKLFRKIQDSLGNFILRRKVKNVAREKAFFNFDTAKSIGVIFDATEQKNYEITRSFLNFCIEKKIRVVALGYIENENASNMYSYQSGVNFYTSKNLTWLRIPKSENVSKFIELKLDILIDLTTVKWFPVDYIIALSVARFKVGRLIEDNSYYDMMIDIRKKPNIEFFISQVKHYLTVINKKTN